MSNENTDNPGLQGARVELQKLIVKSLMDNDQRKPVIAELDGGAGVFATHKITFLNHELYVHSEEDAEFAEAAITAPDFVAAAKFAGELTGAGRG